MANVRELRAISHSDRKSDHADAEKLARFGQKSSDQIHVGATSRALEDGVARPAFGRRSESQAAETLKIAERSLSPQVS